MEDLNSLLSELFRLLAIQVALIYNICGNKAENQSNAVDQIKSLFNLLAWIFAQKTQGISPVTLVILWLFILHYSEKYLRIIASVPVKFTDIQQRDKYSCLIL